MTLEEMRKRKKQLGYSNAQLSNLSGIPLGTLNKILSGATKKPSPENVKAIEQVLLDTTYQYGYVSAAPYMLHEDAGYLAEEPRGKRPGEFTIEDYYALPEDKRVELIDGVFYDMASPSVAHQLITGSIYSQFLNYIRGKKGKCLPLVSPSSTSRDYVRKAAKYIEAGVREYWIIDPMKNRVVTYNFAEDAVPLFHPLGGQLPVAIYDGDLLIDLDEYKMLLEEGV